MKYSEIKTIATNRLNEELFKSQGFQLRKGGLGGGFGFYNDKLENRVLSIGCGISIYGEKSIVRHISGRITFTEIEEIFSTVTFKHGLRGNSKPADWTTISINKIPGFENIDYSRYQEDIVITDESGVDMLVERMKEFYHTIAAPAFNAFTSIEQLVPMMENLDFYDFTKNFGMGSQFKKAIIWKLCNRPDYPAYMQDLIDRTEKFLGPNRDQIEGFKWYNTAIELKEILDNTTPKYNV